MRLVLLLGLTACANTAAWTDLGDVDVLTVTRDYTNAHVAVQGDAAVMFDAGLERNAADLDEALRDHDIDPEGLDAIILTHGHADHAGGASWFQAEYGTPVVVGLGDEDMLATGINEPLCPTSGIAEGRVETDQSETYTPFVPDQIVGAETDLTLVAGLAGRIIPQPGHTEGSLIVDLGPAIVVGDLLRGSITGRAARRHFYQCDLDVNQSNIDATLDTIAPEADTWLVGHFGPLTRDAVGKLD